ncbi:telomere length regulation protein [Nitzschia inconspicua]|uniref:Telomere length regulation protein n=1 Tax=Nitzschia inconspicua TaxID=303405 RepID=A0A9K3KTV4_9STRA|nr:telomere length regulation protein [Nitzschia inconspicua]
MDMEEIKSKEEDEEDEILVSPPPKPEYERHLDRCRDAATRQEQDVEFQNLHEYLKNLDESNGSAMANAVVAREIIARCLLTEWPYSQLHNQMDRLLDACGVMVTVSTCSALLKEVSTSTKTPSRTSSSRTETMGKGADDPSKEDETLLLSQLPPQSVVVACWKTIQRMLLNGSVGEATDKQQREQSNKSIPTGTNIETAEANAGDEQPDVDNLSLLIDRVECQQFISTVLLRLPQTLANACHAVQLKLPIHATSPYFYPRLVHRACRQQQRDESSKLASNDQRLSLFAKLLLQNLLRTNRTDFVAQGLAKILSSSASALLLQSFELSSRDMAGLVLALLQYADSGGINGDDSLETQQSSQNIREACTELFQTSSPEHQDMMIERLVFSTKLPCLKGKEERWSQWIAELILSLQASPPTFLEHLTSIAQRWSEWRFVQDVDGRQQHHVSLILLYGINCLVDPGTVSLSLPSVQDASCQDLNIAIMHGISHRLESTLTVPRRDGMRIATVLAKGLGQEIHFDELDEAEQEDADDEDKGSDDKAKHAKDIERPSSKDLIVDQGATSVARSRAKKAHSDPDADYDSDDEPDAAELANDDDISVEWDDELIPYDLSDDEEDLKETPLPMDLVEALALLRTSENDDHAFSSHEASLTALPELIRSRPDDLPDIAVSIALELLRIEDKFNMEKFDLKRQSAILALLVEEPVNVGSTLVEQLFEDSGLGDRLNIMSALQGAAMELSGHDTSQQQKIIIPTKIGDKETTLSLEQGTNILSKTRIKRSRPTKTIIKNRFTPVAPMWFYSMIAGFLKHKEHESMWSGSTGSIFLAYFFRCLSSTVEFSGPQVAPVLANDLFELVWDFRTADVAEIRLSVLISVATSISMLSAERMYTLLLEEDSSLPRTITSMAGNDPDKSCRELSRTISESIYEVMRGSDLTL